MDDFLSHIFHSQWSYAPHGLTRTYDDDDDDDDNDDDDDIPPLTGVLDRQILTCAAHRQILTGVVDRQILTDGSGLSCAFDGYV